jgi:hypothetical protein
MDYTEHLKGSNETTDISSHTNMGLINSPRSKKMMKNLKINHKDASRMLLQLERFDHSKCGNYQKNKLT